MVHGSLPTHKTRARAFRGLENRPVRRPMPVDPLPCSAVWMRLWAALFVVTLGLLPAGIARAERTLVVAPIVGLRSFESKLDLGDEAAIGARLGIGTSDRVAVLVDYVHTAPARKSTGQLAYITGLRTLAQVRVMTGEVRPYVVAGVGGVLFNFSDANDTAGGAVTVGAGLEVKPWRRAAVFAEGSLDFYRTREVLYSTTGDIVSSGPRSTDQITTVEAGVALEF